VVVVDIAKRLRIDAEKLQGLIEALIEAADEIDRLRKLKRGVDYSKPPSSDRYKRMLRINKREGEKSER
jgi:hypothetical protein